MGKRRFHYTIPTVYSGWLPRKIGFAPWVERKRIDDPRGDIETFHEQAERLREAMALPDEDDSVDVDDM